MFVIPDRYGYDVTFIEVREAVWEGVDAFGTTWEIHGNIAEASQTAREIFTEDEDDIGDDEEYDWDWEIVHLPP